MRGSGERKFVWQLERGDGVGIVCCSDGWRRERQQELSALLQKLEELGLRPRLSPCIYEKDGAFSGSGRERARALMDFYRDASIRAIFDLSGGNAANEVLPFLDFDAIAGADKLFWGYSDLTVILNAVYAKTGRPSVLWQVRNLLYERGKEQEADLTEALSGTGETLFSFPFRFLQKDRMEGVILGGNLRCLLKLAGTPFWPEMEGKLLLLEARSGGEAMIASGLAQLRQMGVFDWISGLLLGTFTELEKKTPGGAERLAALAKEAAGAELPIAGTDRIGHGPDSAAVLIGGRMILESGRAPRLAEI